MYIYIYHLFTWVRGSKTHVEITAYLEIAAHSSPVFLRSHPFDGYITEYKTIGYGCENGVILWQFQWRKIGYAMVCCWVHKLFLGKPIKVRVNESQRVSIQGGTGSHAFLRLFEEAWCFCQSRATWHFFLGPEFVVVRLVYILIVDLCTLFSCELSPWIANWAVFKTLSRPFVLVGIPLTDCDHPHFF